MPSRMDLGGLLFGFGLLIAALANGIRWTWNDPVAFYNLMLSFWSHERAKLHVDYMLERYFQALTRDSLLSTFRQDLSGGNYGTFSQIRERKAEHNRLRRIFDKYAINQDGEKVWTRDQFSVFLSERLGNMEPSAVLWRCFCYSAASPFDCQKLQRLNIHQWMQAVLVLSTDAVQNVGFANGSGMAIFEHQCLRSKHVDWNGFSSFASTSDRQQQHGQLDTHDDWQPPQVLDRVVSIVNTQLPLDMGVRRGNPPDTRSRVRKLVDEEPQISVDSYYIPYQDLLALTAAILQIRKQAFPSQDGYPQAIQSSLTAVADQSLCTAIAAALLVAGGITRDMDISFEAYQGFLDKFHLPSPKLGTTAYEPRSFHCQVTLLWTLLFSASATLAVSELEAEPTLPPPMSQALDLLYPLSQDEHQHHARLRQNLKWAVDFSSDASMTEVLQPWTHHYCPKTAVMYGTRAPVPGRRRTRSSGVHNATEGEPVVFVVMTSSPIWVTYNGKTEDFLAGEEHFIFEVAPTPRALWCTDKRAKFVDMTSATDTTFTFGSDSVGLSIDVDGKTACLRSRPSESDKGYVEVPVGPYETGLQEVDNVTSWETVMNIEKMEVYEGNPGVDSDLIVARKTKRSMAR